MPGTEMCFMKKAVFTVMAAFSLPVLLASCGLFEQSSGESNLPPPTQPAAPKAEAPVVGVKKTEAVPKTDVAPVADVKKEAPKADVAPVAGVKKTEAAPKAETPKAPAADVKDAPKADVAPVAEVKDAPKVDVAPVADVKDAPKAETPKITAPPAVELPAKYVVKTNDSLWRLSVDYYGKGAKWTVIYEANKDKIKNPDHLEPGIELTIPALPTNQ